MAIITYYTIYISSILQWVFIIMIVVEVFRLFGSFGRSKEGTAITGGIKDGAVSLYKGISNKIDDVIKKNGANAIRKQKDLQDKLKAEEELGRFLGTLVIEQKHNFEKLKEGLKYLKNFLEKENAGKLFEPGVLPRIKTGILEPMAIALQKIRDDVAKILYATRRTKIDIDSKQELNAIEQDYEKIRNAMDTLLQRFVQQKKVYDAPNSGYTNDEKKFLNESIEFTTSFYKTIYMDFLSIKQDCENLKNDKYLERNKKILDMIRQGRIKSSSDELRTNLDKLLKAVSDLESSKNDPKKRGEALTTFQKSVLSFETNLAVFAQGEADLMNNIGSVHEDVKLTEDKLNHLKSVMQKIDLRFSEFKESDKVKGLF